MSLSRLAGVVSLILCVLSIAPLWYFWSRRHHSIVKPRLPVLTTISLGCMILSRVITSLERVLHRTPCWASVFSFPMGVVFPSTVFVIRAFVLWFSFEIVRERIEFSRQNDKPGWFMRHYHFICKRYIYAFVNFLSIIAFVISIYNAFWYAVHEEYYIDGENDCSWLPTTTVTYMLVLSLTPIIILTSFKLRGEYDSFGIKLELKIIAILGSMSVFLMFVLMTTGILSESNSWIAYSISDILVLVIANIPPLVVLFHFSRNSVYPIENLDGKCISGFNLHNTNAHENQSDAIILLQRILNIQTTYNMFFEHCRKEFCIENVLALEQLASIRQDLCAIGDKDISREITLGFKIFWSNFVAPDAFLMICISPRYRLELRHLHEIQYVNLDSQCALDLVTSIEFDVLKLLAMDTFRRFQHSEEGKSCMDIIHGIDAAVKCSKVLDIGFERV